MPSLINEISELIRASVGGIWVTSYEQSEVLSGLVDMVVGKKTYKLATYDVSSGLSVLKGGRFESEDKDAARPARAALRWLCDSNTDVPEDKRQPAVLFIHNGHFLRETVIVQALINQILSGKSLNQVVILAAPPRAPIPIELQKFVVEVRHPLPDRVELVKIMQETAETDWPEDKTEQQRLEDAAAGLTRMEAESAVATSIVRHKKLDPDTVFQFKQQAVHKSSSVKIYEGEEDFSAIGGLEHLKSFCLESLAERPTKAKYRPKGVLLVGVSGGGKSLFAKALGKEIGWPTLSCNLSATFGGVLGASQANLREMLDLIDSMSPCIAFFDEIEKMLAGAGTGGRSDGGVKDEMVGELLRWQQDRSSAYVVATCNDISGLTDRHPELFRAGRFDGMFFIDFPDEKTRKQIWDIHRAGYEIEDDKLPNDDDWTGAEIESCCRLARLRGKTLQQIGHALPTIANIGAEAIQRTRSWAENRCWDANHERLFGAKTKPHTSNGAAPRRAIRREDK